MNDKIAQIVKDITAGMVRNYYDRGDVMSICDLTDEMIDEIVSYEKRAAVANRKLKVLSMGLIFYAGYKIINKSKKVNVEEERKDVNSDDELLS